MRWATAAGVAAVTLAAACSTSTPPGPESSATVRSAAPSPSTPRTTTGTTPGTTPGTTTGTTTGPPARFAAARAMRAVRHLAGRIGPRPATGPAFREAASWVAAALTEQGYDVRGQAFPVPAGDSWGVPVAAGRSANVVATPADFDPTAPWPLIGA